METTATRRRRRARARSGAVAKRVRHRGAHGVSPATTAAAAAGGGRERPIVVRRGCRLSSSCAPRLAVVACSSVEWAKISTRKKNVKLAKTRRPFEILKYRRRTATVYTVYSVVFVKPSRTRTDGGVQAVECGGVVVMLPGPATRSAPATRADTLDQP